MEELSLEQRRKKVLEELEPLLQEKHECFIPRDLLCIIGTNGSYRSGAGYLQRQLKDRYKIRYSSATILRPIHKSMGFSAVPNPHPDLVYVWDDDYEPPFEEVRGIAERIWERMGISV